MEPASLIWSAPEGALFPATSGPWTIDVPYLYDVDQPHLSLFYNSETIATKLTIIAAKVLAQRIENAVPSFSKQISVVGALFEELSRVVPDPQATLARTAFVSGRRQGLKDAIRIVTENAPTSPLTSPDDTTDQYDLELIEDRDIAQDWADRLAAALAPLDVIGEHSSANNPWANALEYALVNAPCPPSSDDKPKLCGHHGLELKTPDREIGPEYGDSLRQFGACSLCFPELFSEPAAVVDLRLLQEEVSQWQRHQFRPNGEPPNSLIDGLKICEEAGEIARALSKIYLAAPDKKEWQENLRDELGDLLITALGLSANEGLELADILATRWHQVSQRNYRGLV